MLSLNGYLQKEQKCNEYISNMLIVKSSEICLKHLNDYQINT